MNSYEIKSKLKYITTPSDEWGNVSIEDMLSSINIANPFTLDDVVLLKKINKDIEARLDRSITRFLRAIISSKFIRYNEAEIQAFKSFNKLFEDVYKKQMSHEFIVLESLSRSLLDANDKKRDIPFDENISSYPTDKEIDIVLCNNNSRFYYSYLRLFISLAASLAKNIG